MSESIFSEISSKAEILTDEDLDNWVLPSIMMAYDRKLRYLAYKVYGNRNEVPDLAVAAFRESAREELRTALSTFLFKKEHWRNGRDLDPYLRLCLNRLATRRSWETNSVKVKSAPVCPLCRESGRKEILRLEDGVLRCYNCTEVSERILDEIKANKADTFLQCKYNVHSKFALHSKKGYRCPDCSKFIPESLTHNGKVTCPYDDCIFSGLEIDVDACTHPTVSFNDRSVQSIGKLPTRSSQNDSKRKYVSALTDGSVSTDAYYDVKSQFETELKILTTVICEQLERVKRTNSKSTATQKLLMYKAYQKMLDKHPIEMVAYLVHRDQRSDFPIQARIFQTYAKLVEDFMPFTITKRGEEIDIVDLTSPDLALFNGISEFETKVRPNHTIPNETKEEYIGGRSYKNYGPCFFGKIIDIIDLKTGESIKDQMVEFSFSQIKMKDSVEYGRPVKVTHYRILSHYEMDSLVFLQRTRRDIVDSVHFRLNNEKRKVGK
jgi:hypothetical protein